MSTLSSPVKYEDENVHAVYEQIAPHFSATRYKPWPRISTFLLSLAPGSIGLDIGCGNGKNLDVNPDVYILGSDRSEALARIASSATSTRKHGVVVADILELPHPVGLFDFAICIAVVHHLSNQERRVAAIKSVLATLRAGGTALFYVWALEQKGSRRGWDEGGEQDVMVPWVLKAKKQEEKVFQRYYHLYRKGEIEHDICSADGEVVDSGYEKDNWWAVAVPKQVKYA